MERDDKYLRAKKRVKSLKAFYIHLTIYILVNVMLFVINIIYYPSYLWFLYQLGGWGIAVAVHGLTTLSLGKFGADWEERKIKEFIGKDK